jgi:hypothetical protein
MLLKDSNRMDEAEPLLRRALAIDEKVRGPVHPKVATRLNNLALVLEKTNRVADAEPLMRRSFAILLGTQRLTGHEHPNASTASSIYARLLKKSGKSPAEIKKSLEDLRQAALRAEPEQTAQQRQPVTDSSAPKALAPRSKSLRWAVALTIILTIVLAVATALALLLHRLKP